ncbi:GT2 family glycosyltransferase [Crossiella equi]|uniref:GT2 family glycosyltransferase n=1 Tax=Crossiella equi TaxID=130796 RepID=A0ABS5AI79_9PSEU|nr:glycosyltransferase family 2 protein [Crossiella equi]MBP2475405.1 GT2 family glycosyltransferase [Crossiella equi]
MISLDVIVPYYGDPEYLMRAVASVRALEDTDWKMTIVEDRYPDGPAVEQRVKELGDDRITYLRNEENLGTAGNHFRCVQLSDQHRFVVMGADDLLLPNYGREVARLVEKYPNAGLVQPGVQVIDEQDQPHRPLPDRVKDIAKPQAGTFELSAEEAAASLLRGNWLYTPAIAYRPDLTKHLPLREGTNSVHDLALAIDVLLQGASLVVGDTPAFRYRRHRQGHSTTVAKTGLRFNEERAYFELIERELTAHGWPVAAKAARRRLFSRLNALTQVPGAVLARQGEAVKTLLGHALR